MMEGQKPYRSFIESTATLFRWRQLALARWVLFAISLCLTLTGDELPNEDLMMPIFVQETTRNDPMIMQHLDQADLYVYSKSAKGGKSAKESKMGKHEGSSKVGKSKGDSNKAGKSADKSGKEQSAKSQAENSAKSGGKSAKSI